ncbi:MAG TPA: hypothetical protein VFS51_00025 [Gemmatimonadales bacterium]|nr:hypothetical protein [Gemmatimonadales bacterium]
MGSLRLPILIASWLVSIFWCRPAAGQWAIAAEVGADRFWGGSAETGPEGRSFRPYRPTTFGAGLVRRGRRVGFGLRLRHASAALAFEGSDALVAAKGIFTVYSASPEVIYRVTTVGAGNLLLLHGGPLFELWSVSNEDSQRRVGIQGAVSLLVPLGRRFAGTFSAGAAVTPSPFQSDQLDAGFERRALWRRRVAGGLEYRL